MSDEDLCLRLVKERGHLRGAEAKIEDHRDHPDFHEGKVDHGELGAVGQQHHRSVALFHPLGEQPIGHSIRLEVKLGEGQLRLIADYGNFIGTFAGLPLQIFTNDHACCSPE